MSGSRPKDGKRPTSVDSHQPPSQHFPAATGHLPWEQKYNNRLRKLESTGNPRQGMPVQQWLREWERKWERITGGTNTNGQ